MKAATFALLMMVLCAGSAQRTSAQTALDPAPRTPATPPPQDRTERQVQIDAGLVTIGGRVYRQATVVAVGAAQVRFVSPDGNFSVPWAKVPWNLRAKLEAAHAEAASIGEVLAAKERRRERLVFLGLELIDGVVIGKTGGGILIELTGGKGRAVVLRGHPDQSRIADYDRISGAGRLRGTHEYSTGFFSLTKTARVYDFVPGE